MRIRTSRIIGAALIWLIFAATPARAQQGYGFGIRFDPAQFRQQTFSGFNFARQSFRLQLDQPIQFGTITFSGLGARAYRSDGNTAAARAQTLTPRVDQPLQIDAPPIRTNRTRYAVHSRDAALYAISRPSEFTRPEFVAATRTQPVQRRLAQSPRGRLLTTSVPRFAANVAQPTNLRRLAANSRSRFSEPLRTARLLPPPRGPRAAFAPAAGLRVRRQ